VSVEDHTGIIRHFLGRLRTSLAGRGVVHVGAHQGEEVESYFEHGFQQILLIEANPDWCRWLEE